MPRWVAKKACLGWNGVGCGRLSAGSRCPEHEAEREREKSRRRGPRPEYAGDWQTRSREAREEHVRRFGLVCNGWGEHAPHPVRDISKLAFDHDGQVMCFRCNSAKAGSLKGDKDPSSPAAARRLARGEGR